jgi:predicted ester cyclase
MFRRAFPDSYFTVEDITVEDMMAEADKVATRKTFHGTHDEGEFMGIPPSGRSVTMGLIDIMRISEGRVVEHWAMGDTLGMIQQLGVILQAGRS